jgi:phage-related protein
MDSSSLEPLVWVASSKKDYLGFPADVQDDMGYALYLAQVGDKASSAKPWKGLGPGVFEIVDDHDGDTYRTLYTVRLEGVVYVLHAFQKKAKKGVATPKHEIDLVTQRYKLAREIHEREFGSKKGRTK